MRNNRWLIGLLLSLLALNGAAATSFDHSIWNKLLNAHVYSINGGVATVVDYQGLSGDRDQLMTYREALSKVRRSEFDSWTVNEQKAFLINAYNAWTVELILSAWPELESIKDLGGLFTSPWRKEFVPLLGETRSLDDIEHGLLRASGRYNDPRIHFAVNCASIGCPALRAEAYTGERLDQQLNEQVDLFLRDRSRNRVEDSAINLSPIFKWYREDFEKGWLGYQRLEDFLLEKADALQLSEPMKTKLRNGKVEIDFLNYDWNLNKK
ncbi:DUF547 domain-containing protein [Microbulbifer thermotolerans]|uniref:DUF547 domain-containing protein n=1 Tax=Microbulbifer thermotolerans TaxID=252514 RepID=UPI00224935F6|nr:DUF547 domain-containing protein [Microbulbifer thermotolerans]MCX2795762.1 DUF547 domain-containing protein [Microbulbifer thermotolerans]MCX2842007.1 DUF547 domain-containing protein [Microbulbifer thermotolerans]WKT60407.1 DUF547 domain-containing protein [Microbulbifer thermotolerans]